VQESSETNPHLVRALLAMITLMVLIALGILYPFAQSVAEAEVADSPLPTGGPADLSRFRADAWFLPDELLLGFVHVPGGPFHMGSDPAVDSKAFDNERWSQTAPQGTVEVPDFYIGRYEVTVAQYRAFTEATGHTVSDSTLAAPADHPAVGVTWPDALAYVRWLQKELTASSATPPELRRLLTEGWKVTLPTEAEWEKAARGTDGRIYPWGNEPNPARANFASQSLRPVGSYECAECAYGLADMSGNAWEWTRSPYQPLPYDATDDREGLEADALWVMRGGSFADPPELVRAAIRGGADPGVRRWGEFIGFRLALTRE
jgi:formylglycine-generating enzyme required for sulfatase activity